MKIAVIGTGYVGLVTAACFAQLGHTVTGVDIDEAKVKLLKSGKSPIYEPGLEELIEEGLREKRLSFTTDLLEVLPHAQVVFCAVATPPGEGYKADLTAVFKVAEAVAHHADHDIVFITKSTVPVGTCKRCEDIITDILKKRGVSHSIAVVDNPEFLREGMAVTDTLMPERIVVGVNGTLDSRLQTPDLSEAGALKSEVSHLKSHDSSWARELMEELYRPITRVGKPLVFMNRESAEIVKYASNAFLATKISFINMLSELAEKTGANIREVAIGMGLDSRIGPRFLHAGIGYGGSCFPKDVKALMATAKEYGVPMPLVEATDAVNTYQRKRFLAMVLKTLPKNAKVAVWGLAFKPKTDDMREAPSLDIVPALLKAGHAVTAYDPVAMDRAKPLLPAEMEYANSPLEAAKGAHAIVLLTEWDMFRGLDLKEAKAAMQGTLLFDGRNVYEPHEVRDAGLQYHGIGIRA